MDEDRRLFKVPSTVLMEGETTAGTPRSSNRRKSLKGSNGGGGGGSGVYEVDAYENPTELFQWINYGNYQAAAVHALENPREVKTWIVSHVKGGGGGADEHIKWRYLPLHLACMKPNAAKDLIRALIYSYPGAARERDSDGNLCIHYMLAEGCDHSDVLEMMLKAYPESIEKRDRKGRNQLEIVSEGYRTGKLSKDTMVNMLAILRQWAITEERGDTMRNTQRPSQNGMASVGHEEREAAPMQQSSKPVFRFQEKEVRASKIRSKSRGRTIERKETEITNRSKRSASRGQQRDDSNNTNTNHDHDADVYQIPVQNNNSHGKRSHGKRDEVETRLEDTQTERDVLRKTVAQLKNETKTQEMALLALNKQVEDSAAEHQKLREKLKKKSKANDDLVTKLNEKESRLANHEHIFFEKEKLIQSKDKEIQELKEMLRQVSEETTKIQVNATSNEEVNSELSERLNEAEGENEDLRQQIDDLLQWKVEVLGTNQKMTKEMQVQINELQGTVRDLRNEKEKALSLLVEAKATETRLQSRVVSLERELDSPVVDESGNYIRGEDGLALKDERDALKEMNASLQEHIGALKERCRHLEENEVIRDDLQQKVQRMESDLVDARLKQTKYHDQLMHAKSESVITESRLQTQVARLEMALIEARNTQAAETMHLVPSTVEDDTANEDRKALQAMNESLKEHVGALKDKCGALEKSLEDARNKNIELSEEIRLAKYDGLGERQKELQSEFQNLYSMIQGISSNGQNVAANTSKMLEELKSENDFLRKELSKLRSENESLEEELSKLHPEKDYLQNELSKLLLENESLEKDLSKLLPEKKSLEEALSKLHPEKKSLEEALSKLHPEKKSLEEALSKLQPEKKSLEEALSKLQPEKKSLEEALSKLQSEKESLQKLVSTLKTQISESQSSLSQLQTIESTKTHGLEFQLRDMTQKADLYKTQLADLKENFEKVRSNNANLRDIIAKNNDTYLSKVNMLNRELDELRKVNQSLHAHVHDLSIENERMTSSGYLRGTVNHDTAQKKKMDELSARLNHVAGYLIAVTLMLQAEKGEKGDSKRVRNGHKTEPELIEVGKHKRSAQHGELRQEVFRRQEAILASDDRDDIVQRANHFGKEMRSGFRSAPSDLSSQHQELTTIAAALNSL